MALNLPDKQKIAVVIFARDESSVIRKTVESVQAAIDVPGSLYVVADNCTDNTAEIARDAGAVVFSRDTAEITGKGDAIAWFMQVSKSRMLEYDFLVIIDADSLIPEDFTNNIHSLYQKNIQAAQCRLSPTAFENSSLASLIALSENIEHTIFDRIRSALGFSVRLRGTGMVLDPRLLLKMSSRIKTQAEDISLTLLLAEENITIHWLKNAVVFDPKPKDQAAASRQRARWFRGQWSALWHNRSIVLKLITRGPSGWSILSSLFLKPRWLKWTSLAIVGLVFVSRPAIAVPLLIYLGLEMILTIAGMLALPDRIRYLRAILFIPHFVLMWIKGIALSFRRYPWLRVRDSANLREDGEPDPRPF